MDKPIFSPDYFIDEVREGFYVSEMMKRLWAAQIMVLYEIVKICDRHSITWYAEIGTLLGAVRHKGYIPWDDDLDISMKREDWEKFFKYAGDELPEGYCVLSLKSSDEYDTLLGRITSSHSINFNRDYMEKFQGCPYCVGVDIFPIDKLYKDPVKEQDRRRRGNAINDAIGLIGKKGIDSIEVKKAVSEIERDNHVKLCLNKSISRKLLFLLERVFSECRDEDYEQVASMSAWIFGGWGVCSKYLYDKQIELPFENIIVKASDRYDELLRTYYRDYMTVIKGGGAHGYPVYGDQEAILKEHLGHNPYRYTFKPDDLSPVRKEPAFAGRCREIIKVMRQAESHGAKLAAGGDAENAVCLLSGCQEMAITLGTMLEGRYGQDCSVVRDLEKYCELLYQMTQSPDEKVREAADNTLNETEDHLESLLNSGKKEIVFLPCREVWWDTMKPLYDSIISLKEYNVHLIPVPYYYRNPYGETGERVDESEFFKGLEGYTEVSDYDTGTKHPDIIVMQVPFDGYSCAITVPEKYYSDNLLRCCDELWYVPCFDPDPPESPNDKAAAAIPVLIEQPAVINADKVIIDNGKMRAFYIGRLVNMAGEETREYWENKIQGIRECGM